ncbi:enoyl-CoA hydratase/isomerase family protein [Nocardioides sp. KR10-350]|uniref:enoyl-CoA hydratase/isomerase family protein n=1 Tax=Nocardioides cheoyonin TaxID=3156615 RepID=UPI0032B43B83
MSPLSSGSERWEAIRLDAEDGLAVLRLDRPRLLNAVDDQMRAELKTAVDILGSDDSLRGLIVTGTGRAFCAGGDIRSMEERAAQGNRASEIGWRRQVPLHETLQKLYGLGFPTLAALNGSAHGLGLDLALNCDFIWAVPEASLSSAFIKRGLIPDGGGLFHLPRRIGPARAKELVFSGRSVTAQQALAWGLVDRIVAADALMGEARGWLGELGGHPLLAQALAKGLLNRSLETGLEALNQQGRQAQAICFGSAAHREQVDSFLASRRGSSQ